MTASVHGWACFRITSDLPGLKAFVAVRDATMP
jgi:hypothetical protein